MERKLLGRSRNHLTGQRLPGRLENKAVAEEGAILQEWGRGKPHQREPGRRAWSAPVLGSGEKKGWVPIEYPPHHSKLTGPLTSRKLCLPVHPLPPPPPPPTLSRDLGLPAIREGWPQKLPEAYHCRGCPCTGLLALWRGYTSTEKHQTPPAP